MVPPDRDTPDNTAANLQLTPTDSTIMQFLGEWLTLHILPVGWSLFQGQQNRLATPTRHFVIMQPLTRKALATPRHHYDSETVSITEPIELTLKLTANGEGASTILNRINSLWRTIETTRFFRAKCDDIAPLFSDGPVQKALTTAEQQYEDTWAVTLHLTLLSRLQHATSSALSLSMTSVTQVDHSI